MGEAIVGIGTARAPYASAQEDLGRLYAAALERAGRSAAEGRRARRVFEAAGIETRRFALPDFRHPERAWLYRDGALPSIGPRLAQFAHCAPPLAAEACERALAAAGIDRARVVHLAVASCTGVGAPDLDVELAQRLKLAPAVERSQLVWMSCSAAFPALRAARHALARRPGAYALAVCVELCSLHVRADRDRGSLVAHSLFGDGASAVVLGRDVTEREALATLGEGRTALRPDGRDALTWRFDEGGFRAHIDRSLPARIEASLVPFAHGMAPAGIEAWCVHPGGRAILDAVERAFALDPSALASAHQVLRSQGNLSSATLFHVLEAELARQPAGAPGLMLGFGVGLTLEALRFTRGAAPLPRREEPPCTG